MQRTRWRKQKVDETKSEKTRNAEGGVGVAAKLQMAQEVEAKTGRNVAEIAERKLSLEFSTMWSQSRAKQTRSSCAFISLLASGMAQRGC
jgi:hypothetical protein